MAQEPTIYYFSIRGRAEPFKLLLVSQGVGFKLQVVSMEEIKDLSNFKFGQVCRPAFQLTSSRFWSSLPFPCCNRCMVAYFFDLLILDVASRRLGTLMMK